MFDPSETIRLWLENFPTSVVTVNVSSGVLLAGRWLSLKPDLSDEQLAYRLEMVFAHQQTLCVTILTFITLTDYEPVRVKLVQLQNTYPHRCILNLL